MKTQHFTLSIPEPCGESWDEMQPCASGKFCGNCQKTVTDFTGYSDTELTAFFADKEGENVCGRFYAHQIEAKVFSYTKPVKRPYRTLAMAASVAALTVMSFTAEGQEIDLKPVIKIADSVKTPLVETSNDSSLVIEGVVRDENNELILDATIRLFENGKVITGSVSDLDGNYRIEIPHKTHKFESDSLLLNCYFLGYLKEEKVLLTKSITNIEEIDFLLKRPQGTSRESVFIGLIVRRPNPALLDRNNPGSKTTISAPQLEKMPR